MVGNGRIGYVGGVNGEENSDAVVLEMLGLTSSLTVSIFKGLPKSWNSYIHGVVDLARGPEEPRWQSYTSNLKPAANGPCVATSSITRPWTATRREYARTGC